MNLYESIKNNLKDNKEILETKEKEILENTDGINTLSISENTANEYILTGVNGLGMPMEIILEKKNSILEGLQKYVDSYDGAVEYERYTKGIDEFEEYPYEDALFALADWCDFIEAKIEALQELNNTLSENESDSKKAEETFVKNYMLGIDKFKENDFKKLYDEYKIKSPAMDAFEDIVNDTITYVFNSEFNPYLDKEYLDYTWLRNGDKIYNMDDIWEVYKEAIEENAKEMNEALEKERSKKTTVQDLIDDEDTPEGKEIVRSYFYDSERIKKEAGVTISDRQKELIKKINARNVKNEVYNDGENIVGTIHNVLEALENEMVTIHNDIENELYSDEDHIHDQYENIKNLFEKLKNDYQDHNEYISLITHPMDGLLTLEDITAEEAEEQYKELTDTEGE